MQYLMLYLNSNLDSLSKPKLKPNPDSCLDSDARSDSGANPPSQLGLILPGSILDPFLIWIGSRPDSSS